MRISTTFLTEEDFRAVIREDRLEEIVEGDPKLLADAERKAAAEMESYLAPRFDVGAALSARGDERHPALVMFLADMALYHLHSRINPGRIAQLRNDRYDAAVAWLRDVAKGLLDPGLPVLAGGTGAKFGSRPKRENYF